MSKIEVNTVAPQCGTTLTLGESGDTVTLGSGASQSGFGRTGTVDWQTTKKTTAFTAANGEGYFVDTAASGAVTMTLPSSPSAGNIVAVKDYNGNFATANLTIGRGGSPINGAADADVVISTDGASIVLVYVDATQGWVATQDDSSTFSGATFIAATGGTVTCCGNCKIHTFTGPGTFAVSVIASAPANNKLDYAVVAGGAGGGAQGGGGGGAGGMRFSACTYTAPCTSAPRKGTALTATVTSFPITVGGGGAGGPAPGGGSGGTGSNGNPSVFSTITSTGGGGGGRSNNTNPPGNTNGNTGGSGGGTGKNRQETAAAGNTPPVSPPQGFPGGPVTHCTSTGAGGGGGASVAGSSGHGPGTPPGCGGPQPQKAGPGGDGLQINITGSNVYYAGGGGGGTDVGAQDPRSGTGGQGGGGNGSFNPAGPNDVNGGAGTANTGGGGGGAEWEAGTTTGGAGGSGIVIIRYKFK